MTHATRVKLGKTDLRPLSKTIEKVVAEDTFEAEWKEAITSEQLKTELHKRIEKIFQTPPKGK
jgi:3-methyladenine DNA glycosylase AlkD